jgi:hypothetical protein
LGDAKSSLGDAKSSLGDASWGPARGENAGARAASGVWLLFCDVHDVWLPKHVASVLEPFHTSPELTHVRAKITRLVVIVRAPMR